METIVAGNWKMHHGPAETHSFLDRFTAEAAGDGVRLLLFVPALSLAAARARLGAGAGIGLGVQNVHWETAGAFTGETSAEMARGAGADFALVGHSERRHLFGETDEEAARKAAAVRRAGMTPVVCVGETLEERVAGRLQEVVGGQLRPVLESFGRTPPGGAGAVSLPLMIAYEPVWAIGTGRTATPEDAGAAHAFIRARLAGSLGAADGASVPILYGGSVHADNARELLDVAEVNGVLVGGASLDPGSFARIAAAASGRESS